MLTVSMIFSKLSFFIGKSKQKAVKHYIGYNLLCVISFFSL